MMPAESPKVLIIGAGPAGAALAQILRKNGVAFEIFEREADLQARRGGGFVLDDALPDMDELLPEDMGDYAVASANYGTGIEDSFAFIDGLKGTVFARQQNVPKGQKGHAIATKRQAIRNWMIQHLDIKTDKKLSRYEEDDDGVTAFFADGTSARGTLLVGADGANSAVRAQMLDNPPRELHDYIPLCGDTVLPREALAQLRKIATAAMVARSPRCHLVLSQLDAEPDGSSARWWWVAAFRSDDPAADTAWVHAASARTLYRRALAETAHLPEIVRDVVRRAGPDGVWTPQIRFSEWVPPNGLPRGRVTLLGDAAHNTTPFGGMGANISIRDACDLGRLLTTTSWDTYGDMEVLLRKYERIMLPRGRKTVLASRAIAHDHEGNKPLVIGRENTLMAIDPIPIETLLAA